jgi:50S ribosomal protein L16 3-hydroxylase
MGRRAGGRRWAAASLGALSPAAFLRDHWQKRPLLIRQALPGFTGIIDRDRFLNLATRADCRSRLIIHHPRRVRDRWERHDGPFGGLDARMLPARHWTLLVNGVESLIPGGWEILRAFSMIPTARIDDLMVSYAADGGTVGPHDDLYDVFLLQGQGRRRWQISTQRDRRKDPNAAIQVLRSFVPEQEWLLEPGDMLYLPPGIAHRGVAEGPCFTYSIGFLAPSHAELVEGFLGYLGAALGARRSSEALYRDADLKAPRDPLEIGESMIAKVAAIVGQVEWDRAMLGDFLGRFLTRPKQLHTFARPARPPSQDAFARRLRARRGRLTLALPSRGLVRGASIFFNGDAHTPGRAGVALFKELMRERSVALPRAGAAVGERMIGLLYEWYVRGYVRLDPG